MIGKIISALIGRQIDRSDGDSGLRGAIIGLMAAGALRRAGPIGLALGGFWVAKKVYDRRKSAKAMPAA